MPGPDAVCPHRRAPRQLPRLPAPGKPAPAAWHRPPLASHCSMGRLQQRLLPLLPALTPSHGKAEGGGGSGMGQSGMQAKGRSPSLCGRMGRESSSCLKSLPIETEPCILDPRLAPFFHSGGSQEQAGIWHHCGAGGHAPSGTNNASSVQHMLDPRVELSGPAREAAEELEEAVEKLLLPLLLLQLLSREQQAETARTGSPGAAWA